MNKSDTHLNTRELQNLKKGENKNKKKGVRVKTNSVHKICVKLVITLTITILEI